ncbi:phage tail sheath subtilisin-like domain-containing protein [Sorangium sp. So ce260]|uniref:phage tail sheath family protein n=1 Tax=Sorangium sp. So ce260 TaxID=3133291 RepID=UPI003F645FB6
MPIQVSYPGVYVSAITSPQPPTGGSSTSIAAFVGRAPMGPVNQATPVLNYAAYTSQFGGLNKDSAISYQVNAFFSNGGAQAVVVRVYSAPQSTTLVAGGTPASTDSYTISYAINGGAQTALAAVSGQTDLGALATALAAAISGDATLKTLVSAKANTNEVGITIGDTSDAITFSTSVTTSAAPAKPGGTLLVGEPSTISKAGVATTPLCTAATVTVGGTVAAGDVYALFLDPPGSPTITISFTATTAVAADVAAGLAAAITANTVASTLVRPSASAAVLTLTYLGAVEIDEEVTSAAGTLTLGFSSSLFSLQAADPGVWGDQITASITTVPASSISLYQRYGLNPGDLTQTLFNLAISYFDGANYQTESFVNVTLWGDDNQVNRLDKVLQSGSQYARCTIPNPLPHLPNAAATTLVGFGAGGAESAPLQVSDYTGSASALTGLYALNQLPYGWNILCVPPDGVGDDQGGDQSAAVYQEAAQVCVDNNAMLIIDPPTSWYSKWQSGKVSSISIDDPQIGSYSDDQGRSSAVYFPRVVISDPLMNGGPKILPPCGFMAAAWASTDTASGVWKAPAGLDVPIGGITGLQANLTDDDDGQLNPQGINVLRTFKTGGSVVWGARTLRGSDTLGDMYKYLPVRRLLLFIETTLQQGTQWAVFQPNGPSLWAKLQTQVSTIMGNLFSQGAFAGTSASQAFFAKCDATTTTQANQAAGIVNVQVGFAPLYPAEFVVITVSQQTAAQSS